MKKGVGFMKRFCAVFLIGLAFLLLNGFSTTYADVTASQRGGWIYTDTEKSKDVSDILKALTNILGNHSYEWKWIQEDGKYMQKYVPQIDSEEDAFKELRAQFKNFNINEIDDWINCIKNTTYKWSINFSFTKEWECKFKNLVNQIKKCDPARGIELYSEKKEINYKTITIWKCINL